MSTTESFPSEDDDFMKKPPLNNNLENDRYKKNLLKSKENIFKGKTKCNKELKKKLKKYKLRKDGNDDPDVLNVSQCLSLSLKIKSPVGVNNNTINCKNDNTDEWRFKNYLVKMAKKTTAEVKINKKEEYHIIHKHSIKDNDKMADNDGQNCLNSSEEEHLLNEVSPSGSTIKPKEMNAFQLMMNARNKSIGSNSPGKEKSEEITEDERSSKQLKLKRNLALEMMAKAKGSLQNKVIEASKDEFIQMKMEKRAKRLKHLLNNGAQISCKTENKNPVPSIRKGEMKSVSKQKNIKRRRRSDILSEKVTKRFKTDVCNETLIEVRDSDDDKDVVEVINYVQLKKDLHSEARDKKIKLNSDNILLTNISPSLPKKIVDSDAIFLNNLSPSIKKKESMLSYFATKSKKCEDGEIYSLPENLIKVKITSKQKCKKRIPKKKYVEEKNHEKRSKDHLNTNALKLEQKHLVEKPLEDNFQITKQKVSCKTELLEDSDDEFLFKYVKKRELANSNLEEVYEQSFTSSTVERRSKRVTKKPIKFQDSIESPYAQSSDEELQLCTLDKSKSDKLANTKKLKKEDALKITVNYLNQNKMQSEENDKKTKKSLSKHKASEKQFLKLAPIFGQKNQLSNAELEAKQKFLQSGVPEQLKKVIDRQKYFDLEDKCFTAVHHVQQMTKSSEDFDPWLLKQVDLNLNSEEEEYELNLSNWAYPHIQYETVHYKEKRLQKAVSVKEKLEFVKKKYPKFPVYRTFRILKSNLTVNKNSQDSDSETQAKSSRSGVPAHELEDPGESTWADKFRPKSSSDIIGNFEGVHSLKQWLMKWKENHIQTKSQHIRKRSDSSDSSDFYYPSDTDSRDSMKSLNNVLVVTGPVGCGKTSAIYAVATELAMKVIEVNASVKRTGKTILSNLQEATQSHKINRAGTSSENSQNSQEIYGTATLKNIKQFRTYAKKVSTNELTVHKCSEALSISQTSKTDGHKAGMSLILVEDADLVFEQDDGFVSALNQIAQISKRPVIIVTSSLTCPHLQRFITNGNVIKFHNLSPKMLGTWLDIVCLIENAEICLHMGQKLLDFCKGDMRKAINTLQFWTASELPNSDLDNCEFKETLPRPDSEQIALEDECSSTSWPDQEQNHHENKDVNRDFEVGNKHYTRSFLSFNDHDIGINNTILQFPVDHLNIWWNIPSIFCFNDTKPATSEHSNNGSEANKNSLNALSKLIDSISASDLMYSKMTPAIDSSVTSNPWRKSLCDSVSEAIDLSNYNRSRGLGDSMSYALLSSSLSITQKAFETAKDVCVDCTLPGMAEMRSREKTIGRHKGLYDGLPLSSHLDRRSVALDYMSACREICRIEKNKSENNNKRNNRFCHYLKSLKVTCSNDALENLCESLGPSCSAGDK